MTMHPSVKKVSLETVSEGYDESCFAYVTPANYKEKAQHNDLVRRTIAGQKGDDAELQASIELESNELQADLIRAHFVSGSIKSFDGKDFSPAHLEVDTAIDVPAISDMLTMFILGYDIDPKVVSKAIQALQIEEKSAAPTTEGSSSSENPSTSPSSTPSS